MKFADDSAGILEPPVAARARALHCGAMSTRIRPSATLFSLLAVLCWSSSTHAGGLPVRTESSLARGILLPALGQSPDDSGWRWQIDLTNEFVLAQNGSESLVLDAETASLRLAETVQINADWFAGAELQLLRTGGGFMDSLIEDWHEFFGLPNAGRERRPQDQYLIRYERDGNTVMEASKADSGLGDLQLWLGKRLSPHWSWRSAVKLPTGDDQTLLGNGEFGLASWLDSHYSSGAWSGFLALGGSYNPAGASLAALRREWTGFGGAGLNWQWTRWLKLRGQVNAHTALFEDTRIEALERPGVQLTLGAGLRFGETEVNLAFQEDIVTQSSPDFSLHLSWHWRQDAR